LIILRVFLLSVALAFVGLCADPVPEVVVLWPGGAPGALGTADEDIPKYTVYQAASPVHTGVLICPGGGYHSLAMDHEGAQVAKWLNGYGVTAFVLQYRLGPKYHHPIELHDAQRAIRMIRAHAREYGLDVNRIGIWGFSAGGHLAATVSTHADDGDLRASDPTDKYPSRANFAVLAYPVISFVAFAHKGSLQNLLGDNPDPALMEELSNEKHVTQQTPPTFLFHTSDDAVVPVENSVMYYEALRKVNVPAEMHIYEHGAHGVGLAFYDPILSTWPVHLAEWMRSHGWLTLPRK
jgi:acetyl esterase/lipase